MAGFFNIDIFLYNNTPVEEFEGLTPAQMHGLIYTPFNKELSPLRLNENIDNKFIYEINYYKHIIQFLSKIKEQQPLRLTQKGNLPPKFLKELIEDGVIESEEDRFLFNIYPPRTELDAFYIHIMNFLTQVTGLTRKSHNRISLTKKGSRYLGQELASELYLKLFLNYITKYNWGYADMYPESWIIQGGFGFTIFLVQKYGNEPRDANFYAEKYLKAFPKLLEDFPDSEYSTGLMDFQNCYKTRLFKKFLYRFGLIEVVKKDKFWENVIIIKKELIDHLVKWDFKGIQKKYTGLTQLPSVN